MTFTLDEDHEPQLAEFDDIHRDINQEELIALLDSLEQDIFQLQTTIDLVIRYGRLVTLRT